MAKCSSDPKTILGTAGFVAPEVLKSRHEIPYTTAIDGTLTRHNLYFLIVCPVFAFGMVIYEILTRYQGKFWDLKPVSRDNFIEEGVSFFFPLFGRPFFNYYMLLPQLPEDLTNNEAYKPIIELFTGCLNYQPAKRPTMKEVLHRLAEM